MKKRKNIIEKKFKKIFIKKKPNKEIEEEKIENKKIYNDLYMENASNDLNIKKTDNSSIIKIILQD